MEIEIEKTYLAKTIPKDLDLENFSLIKDSYFEIMDGLNRIRIREKDDLIKKKKKSPLDKNELNHGLNKEETIVLTQKELENFKLIPTQDIIKKRYYYEKDNLVFEIDIFEENLKGLIMVDVEFASQEEFENFKMPDFCLCDVTQDDEIAGNKLIGKSYEDLQNYLKSKNYKKIDLEVEERNG